MASESINSKEDGAEVLEFNLTNPEQLSNQLEAARLDDDETDTLLKEALRINAKLKEALRLQQLEESSEDEAGSGRKWNPHCPSEPPAPRNPKQSILPPISLSDHRHDVASKTYKSRDSKGKTSKDPQRLGSAPKSRGTPSERKVKRPPWDDRFSFG